MTISDGWIFGPKKDFVVFLMPMVFGLATMPFFLNHLSNPIVNLMFVMIFLTGTDVAHTFSTWFRTHLDPYEWKRHRLRLIMIPIAVFVALHLLARHTSIQTMWFTVLYIAVWHFVRQQIGWVSWTGRRAREGSDWRRRIDKLVIYNCTLYPLLLWHAGQLKSNWWLGSDFPILIPASLVPAIKTVHWSVLIGYVLWEAYHIGATRRLNAAKMLILFTTWFNWTIGIAVLDDNFWSTATWSLGHSVPYLFLIFTYTQTSRKVTGKQAVAGLAIGLALILLTLAVTFDLIRGSVFHYAPWKGWLPSFSLTHAEKLWIHPLLGIVATCHYVFDTFIWRAPDADAPLARMLKREPREFHFGKVRNLSLEDEYKVSPFLFGKVDHLMDEAGVNQVGAPVGRQIERFVPEVK